MRDVLKERLCKDQKASISGTPWSGYEATITCKKCGVDETRPMRANMSHQEALNNAYEVDKLCADRNADLGLQFSYDLADGLYLA